MPMKKVILKNVYTTLVCPYFTKGSILPHHYGGSNYFPPFFIYRMKYWSCCEKKTSEFDNFITQAGCTEGLHTWFKEVVTISLRFY